MILFFLALSHIAQAALPANIPCPSSEPVLVKSAVAMGDRVAVLAENCVFILSDKSEVLGSAQLDSIPDGFAYYSAEGALHDRLLLSFGPRILALTPKGQWEKEINVSLGETCREQKLGELSVTQCTPAIANPRFRILTGDHLLLLVGTNWVIAGNPENENFRLALSFDFGRIKQANYEPRSARFSVAVWDTLDTQLKTFILSSSLDFYKPLPERRQLAPAIFFTDPNQDIALDGEGKLFSWDDFSPIGSIGFAVSAAAWLGQDLGILSPEKDRFLRFDAHLLAKKPEFLQRRAFTVFAGTQNFLIVYRSGRPTELVESRPR